VVNGAKRDQADSKNGPMGSDHPLEEIMESNALDALKVTIVNIP
jgi:hypothetical protein